MAATSNQQSPFPINVPATPLIPVMSDDEARIQRIIEAKRLVLERDEVRSQGNYLKSDTLRDQLKAMGVEVIDQKNGELAYTTASEQ